MPDLNSPSEKKLNIWLPLLFALVLMGGMFIGTKIQPTPDNNIIKIDGIDPAEYSKIGNGRIEELIRFIEAKYVDEVNSEELIEKAISKILEELDPHSTYIPAAQLAKVNEDLEGNFDGVGIEYIILDDTIVVVAPIVGGPSEKSGILAGDKIVKINDSLAVGSDEINVREIVNKLRGEKNTEVKLGILRGREKNILDFKVKRDEIPIFSVDVGYMIDDKTGFIKINRFSATTYGEVMRKVDTLKQQGMEDLVIDLRKNPGGYLQEATKLLSQLFPDKGKLLVYTQGRTERRDEYESTGMTLFPIDKVAVLIDEGSASASEIVAGAVQDWDRGVIVGRRSFGKGLVQKQYDLKDGSGLRLTVARYFTPTDRLIQKSYADKNAYERDLVNRYSGGEFISKDSIELSDTTKYFTKLENRIVYGGGGITPDIFIPMDTSVFNQDYLMLRQIVHPFIYRYAENNASQLNEITLENLRDNFEADEEMLSSFYEHAMENDVIMGKTDYEAIRKNVKLLLKSNLARHYYKEHGFYTIINDEDEIVKAAMRALKKENPLAESDR